MAEANELRCNRSILRHNSEIMFVTLHVPCHNYSVLRLGILTLCALTSSCLDDFSDIVTFIL